MKSVKQVGEANVKPSSLRKEFELCFNQNGMPLEIFNQRLTQSSLSGQQVFLFLSLSHLVLLLPINWPSLISPSLPQARAWAYPHRAGFRGPWTVFLLSSEINSYAQYHLHVLSSPSLALISQPPSRLNIQLSLRNLSVGC